MYLYPILYELFSLNFFNKYYEQKINVNSTYSIFLMYFSCFFKAF